MKGGVSFDKSMYSKRLCVENNGPRFVSNSFDEAGTNRGIRKQHKVCKSASQFHNNHLRRYIGKNKFERKDSKNLGSEDAGRKGGM